MVLDHAAGQMIFLTVLWFFMNTNKTIWAFPKIGKQPKMDGLFHGKPWSNEWFGGTTIFGNTHITIPQMRVPTMTCLTCWYLLEAKLANREPVVQVGFMLVSRGPLWRLPYEWTGSPGLGNVLWNSKSTNWTPCNHSLINLGETHMHDAFWWFTKWKHTNFPNLITKKYRHWFINSWDLPQNSWSNTAPLKN